MFGKIIRQFSGKLQKFYPFGDITDRRGWNDLDEEWKSETILLGEQYLNYEYPLLTAELYLGFSRTGDRECFQKVYFARRYALNVLVLAECAENQGRFLKSIINGIWAVCEESAWQLPAHNSYERDGEILPLPDYAKPIVDLASGETAEMLALIYYLLKKPLDAVSPLIAQRIRAELEHRVFEPYLNKHFWWMGDGKVHLNNWSVWCTQNVLLCAFLTDRKEDFIYKVLDKACTTVDYFLDEYGEDGCCEEGAEYYRHAGLCLFLISELLNAATGGAFEAVYRTEKIKNIAAYILHVHVADGYYINFNDCSAAAGRMGLREFLFAERTGNRELMAYAAEDFRVSLAKQKMQAVLPEESNLYYRLLNGIYFSRICKYEGKWRSKEKKIFYPGAGLFIAGTEKLCLAVKGGNNGDSHNHNDVGSFTVYKDGQPMIIDIGVETYTKKTFSPQRYEIWTMQSAYHNLPTIGTFMQAEGKESAACDVVWEFETDRSSISMDIAGAYPGEAGVQFYRREACLEKGTKIRVKDCFSVSPEAVVISLMSAKRPEAEKCGEDLFFIEIGSLGKVTVKGTKQLVIEEIPVSDPRLAAVWGGMVYRILIQAAGREVEMEIY